MKHRTMWFTTVLLTIIATLVAAAGAQPAAAQTGPRPGDSDPIGAPSRYYLARDDELYRMGIQNFIDPG